MEMSSFLTQHKEALELAGKIAANFSGTTVKNPEEVRSLLSTLVGKLKIHLAMEDKNLYPKAHASSDAALAQMSKKLEGEMAGLAGALVNYSQKWISAASIQANQAGFITETQGVFAALKKRIDVEEGQFYPLCKEKL